MLLVGPSGQVSRPVVASTTGIDLGPPGWSAACGYLRGLLAPLEKKNGWTIAEYTGAPEPKRVQRFLNLTPWSADGLRDLLVGYAMEHFADERAVLIADPTGFAQKGRKSAGVQRQYSGTLGRIDNCRIGTFLAYAIPDGHRVLLDRELYLPENSWAADRERSRDAGVPDKVPFRTRPQQVQLMVERALAAKVPFAWFAADEEFGQHPGLRAFLEERSLSRSGREATRVSIRAVRPCAFTRRACGIGAKGFRTYDWAVLDTDDPDHRFLVRRSPDGRELGYFHCFRPRHDLVGELVRAVGSRWPVEECFEAAKQEAGLDQYQVRKYDAWYRHITMSRLALCLLAVMRRTLQKGHLCSTS
ncbi:IS701 family transposase [Streptomyces sp. WAC07061]|uniref:IS701 family transposase n=1 Tax=Streptomyces sp. WAC07061 TaxID=2487410 RepID=UPI000F7A17CD|nr:IS701 family transposase [Streptomyces sp. WAC07061]RSS64866.1 IS701 family transposase [Streptomyces sp. WAC07061]